MRTTITIDDDIYERARANRPALSLKELIEEALTGLNQREAGRKLAKMAGTMPDAPEAPPRRRL